MEWLRDESVPSNPVGRRFLSRDQASKKNDRCALQQRITFNLVRDITTVEIWHHDI